MSEVKMLQDYEYYIDNIKRHVNVECDVDDVRELIDSYLEDILENDCLKLAKYVEQRIESHKILKKHKVVNRYRK